MPIRYEVNSAERVVRIEVRGSVGVTEVLDHLERLAADPSITPGMAALVDVRGLTRVPSLEEGEAMTRGFGVGYGRFAGSRRAFIVESTVMFGAVRQFAVTAQRWGVEIAPFVDESAALRWIREEDLPASDDA
jgi:hypothetical protein